MKRAIMEFMPILDSQIVPTEENTTTKDGVEYIDIKADITHVALLAGEDADRLKKKKIEKGDLIGLVFIELPRVRETLSIGNNRGFNVLFEANPPRESAVKKKVMRKGTMSVAYQWGEEPSTDYSVTWNYESEDAFKLRLMKPSGIAFKVTVYKKAVYKKAVSKRAVSKKAL
jgi:hypothetical protein